MPEGSPEQVSRLLMDWSRGDRSALEALTPLVYDELRRLARSYMSGERGDHTLQSTALVHEAYLRLVGQRVEWKSRAHFFAIAAKMMRRILVDHAKKKRAAKRGSGHAALSLDEPVTLAQDPPRQLLALDDALEDLARIDPERSQIVELRFFGGLTNEEASEVLNVSPETIQRRWVGARAWLAHEMSRR